MDIELEKKIEKCFIEFIGTFFLVFAVGSTALFGTNSAISAVVVGLALMIMVYAGGYISGGHYNPAVSLAAFAAKALDKKDLLPYWASQFLGALLAVYFARGMAVVTLPDPVCFYSMSQIMLGEFLFTFILCLVVLNTTVSSKSVGNSYYGLVIGATVTVGAFAVGGIACFGAFNPAIAVGMGLLQMACWSGLLVTIFTNVIAGALAAYVYRYINGERFVTTKNEEE